MSELMQKMRSELRLGDRQSCEGMSVFPVYLCNPRDLEYLSMKQAMNLRSIQITEISDGGHVPNLKVINTGDKPVLLLDGEEISGAKQNRILNASILLKEKSETIIPVSCSERGRWSYTKNHFDESGFMMTANMRTSKMESVALSLKTGNQYRSDQGRVWADIEELSHRAGVSSPTDAMKDVYETMNSRLNKYMKEFVLTEKQSGILVCFGSAVIGMDAISNTDVWKDTHIKLIRSYVLEYITSDNKELQSGSEQIEAFWDKLADCKEHSFKSVGYGDDIRLECPEIIGSALVWQDVCIHLEAYTRKEVYFESRYHSPRNRI